MPWQSEITWVNAIACVLFQFLAITKETFVKKIRINSNSKDEFISNFRVDGWYFSFFFQIVIVHSV